MEGKEYQKGIILKCLALLKAKKEFEENVEGFTYKEIAKITEVPLGTAMSRLYTARQILKKQLSKSILKEAR
ncbi:MAG: hypothetical protein NC834_01965 [Candidatus Omnitrophica bacterium]|nr:hypothetical protein [Candidatus Omnitrophota bacterium]